MYKCLDCKQVFDEPSSYNTTYEKYYDIDLPTHTLLILHLCPYCNSEDIEEKRTGDEENE